MTVRELGLGAEVTGVDLRSLDDDAFAEIREALLEHAVLVVREQFLEPEAQVAFTRRFGELHVHNGTIEGHPEMLLLANMRRERIHAEDDRTRKVTEVWHSDYSFWETPPAVLVIAAQELPAVGGDTLFADQRAVLDSLSPRLRALLRELEGVHEAPAYYSGVEPVVHPIVVAHPETGRESLFLNAQSVRSFAGMTREESAGLLAYLVEQSARPEFVYRHRWLAGDVVIWDNRCTIHYAVDDYGDAPRVLHRTSVAGVRPARG